MRVYTNKHTIVDLKHFRFCAKHLKLLSELQQECPNLRLEIGATEGEKHIPLHQIDLENYSEINGLNPNDARSM